MSGPDAARSTVTVDHATGVVADGTAAVTITVTVKDGNGVPVSGAAVALNVSGSANTLSTPAATDASGVTTATLSSTVAETKTITATVGGSVTVAQMPTVQFVAGTATKLAFGVQPTNALAGATISPAITVELEDSNGNAVSSSATVTLAILANPSAGVLSGTASHAASAGVATFNDLSINKPGSGYTLLANSPGITSATSTSFTISVGPATHLVFLSQPSSTTAGSVLGSIQVAIEDAMGNVVTTSSDSVAMSLSNAGGASLSGTTTQMAVNGIATFNDLSITKARTGYALIASDASVMAASSVFDISPAALSSTMSTFVANPGSVAVGAPSTVTVTAKDMYGNLIQGQSVTLAATGTANTLSPTSGTTDVNGVVSATLSSTKAEAKTITATLGAVQLQTTVTVTAGTVSSTNSTLVANPTSLAAGATSTLTITAKDAYGNPIAGQAVTISSTGTANTLTPTSGTTNASGVVTATLSSTKAEAKTVTATLGATQLQTTVAFNPAAVSSTTSTVVANPTSLTAGTSTTLTITAEDVYGNPISGQAVSLGSTGTTNTFTPASGSTNASGVFTATFSSTKAEAKTVTATLSAVQVQTTVTFTVGALSATKSTLVANPTSLTAGGTSNLTVTAEDAFGNPISGQAVTLAATGTANTLTPTSGTTNASGVVTATLSSTKAETKQVTATLGAVQLQTPVTFTPGALSSTHSLLWASPASLVADGKASTLITLILRDQYNNRIGGSAVSLSVGGSNNTLANPSGNANVNGTFTSTLSSTKAELKSIAATIGTTTVSGSVTFIAAPAACAGTPAFPSVPALPALQPNAIRSGDFNGDGHADLVTADATNSISVYLGKGNGTFQTPSHLGISPTPSSPYFVAVADFNADGKLDVATVQNSNYYVTVFLGNGNGTFGAPAQYMTGSRPYSLAAGDFNGDGKLDIVTADNGGHTVSMLLGSGTGTFGAFVSYSTGASSTPVSVAATDFDGDGKLDVAAVDDTHNVVVVLLGNGNGTLGAGFTYPVGQNPAEVVTRDFNGDGHADLAVAHHSDPGGVSVLLGKGDGTFQPFVDYATAGASSTTRPYAVTSTDLNGDGRLDLIAANNYSGDVSVMLGNGDGTFQASVPTPFGASPYGITAADFDGDGHPDIAGDSSYNFAVVLLGTGAGGFKTSAQYQADASYPGWTSDAITTADFNADGIVDLATTNSYGVSVFTGNGDGTFATTPWVSPRRFAGRYLTAADVNLDGFIDIVATAMNDPNGNRIDVLLGNGDGTFQDLIPVTAGSSPTWVAVADLNRDGKPDLAITNAGDSSVYVVLGNGDGTFGAASSFATGTAPVSIVAADFTGDGKLDLLTANQGTSPSVSAGSISLFIGNGGGGFGIGQTTALTTPAQVQMMAVGDVNSDGKIDVVVATAANDLTRDGAEVFLGNGNGTFGSPALFNGGGYDTNWVSLGDFTGDGKIDLGIASVTDHVVSLLSGNGFGNFAKLQSYASAVDSGPTTSAVGDFDFDGRLDMVTGSETISGALAGALSVHLQQGCLP